MEPIKEETLLQKAKKISVLRRSKYKDYTIEDLDLVLAWLSNEVTATQMAGALDKTVTSGNYLYYCASVLKKFHLDGTLIVKKKRN